MLLGELTWKHMENDPGHHHFPEYTMKSEHETLQLFSHMSKRNICGEPARRFLDHPAFYSLILHYPSFKTKL